MILGHADRQSAIPDAQGEPGRHLSAAFGHQVAAGDAQVDGFLGAQHGNVFGPQKGDIDRHLAAARKQAPLLTAKAQARLFQEFAGDFCQSPLTGDADPQIHWDVSDGEVFAGREAFSARPEMPKRRASSASTAVHSTSRQASSTSRW